jgi:hypothetical protein
MKTSILKYAFCLGVSLFFFTTNGQGQPSAQNREFSLPDGIKPENIVPGEIIVKLNPQSTSNSRTTQKSIWDRVEEQVGIQRVQNAIPQPFQSNGRRTNHQVSLDNIYRVELKDETTFIEAVNTFLSYEEVEYAEPRYRYQTLLAPDDPAAGPSEGQQWHHSVIRSYQGWSLSTGDTSIVIGIVDTGVEPNHEDLVDNIAYNYDDPINGIDDDSDGYIDNYYGWDMSNNDNDPTADNDRHGIKVSGVSSATTNNNTGIAGTGWKAKFLPVKISDSNSGYLTDEYEGVLYAAQQGCKVINLSWGAAGANSLYGKDIIDHVVLDLDAVVVAAAGNTHADLDFYPASYDNVLSVGASNDADELAHWATYSYKIDLLAPGEGVFTTDKGNVYGYATGSSFASPMVAGAAALVRQYFPDYSARQVMQQLRTTAYDISKTGHNSNFEGQIGAGRLDVFQALHQSSTPAIRKVDIQVVTQLQGNVLPSDTVEVFLQVKNFLNDAGQLSVHLSNSDGAVHFIDNQWEIGALISEGVRDNVSQPFRFVVPDTTSRFTKIPVRINYEAENYSDFEYFFLFIEEDHLTLSAGDLSSTFTSKGDIGFNKSFFIDGDGVRYKGEHVALNAGFMIGNNGSVLKDNAPRYLRYGFKENDFDYTHLIELTDTTAATMEAYSYFIEKEIDLGVSVKQKVLTWEDALPHDLMVIEYTITNPTETDIAALSTGLFVDWDLNDKTRNAAIWDAEEGFGYVYDKTEETQYAAIIPITDLSTTFYALDLGYYYGNSADFSTFFEDQQKYEYLSGAQTKSEAGVSGLGNDVGMVTGVNNQDLPAKRNLKVAFVMAVAESYAKLVEAKNKAQELYDHYLENPPLWYRIKECTGQPVTIDPAGESYYEFYQDALLQNRLDSARQFTSGSLNTDTAFYLVEIIDGIRGPVKKVVVDLRDPVAAFDWASDTLLVDPGNGSVLHIQNNSENADAFNWDFDNGKRSMVEHPKVVFKNKGGYNISLVASASYGCSDSTGRKLVVVVRSEKPDLKDVQACPWSEVTLKANNTHDINVYADESLNDLLFSGESFTTQITNRDTAFWVVNAAGEYPSVAKHVKVNISDPIAEVSYHIDTTDLSTAQGMAFSVSAKEMLNSYWFIDDHQVSTDQEFIYDYTGKTGISGYVLVEGSNGCTDSVAFNLPLSLGDAPEPQNPEICIDQSISIIAPADRIYSIFSDQSKTQLLYKGSSFISGPIHKDTSFYVTDITNGLESEISEYNYLLFPLRAVINVNNNNLVLIDGLAEARLYNESTDATWSHWVLPTGENAEESELYEVFSAPGDFNYQLIAGNAHCIDTTSITLRVSNISNVEDQIKSWEIYPNPVIDKLNILADQHIQKWQIHSLQGQLVKEGFFSEKLEEQNLSLESLKSGVYLLVLQGTADTRTFKLIKD